MLGRAVDQSLARQGDYLGRDRGQRCVGHARRIEHRWPWPAVAQWHRALTIRRDAHQGLQLVPVGILTSRDGLAYTRQAVTQADVACLTAGVAELSEAAIFPGDDELWRRRWKLGSGHSLK